MRRLASSSSSTGSTSRRLGAPVRAVAAPGRLRAVHFVVDHQRGDELAESWREHGLASIALEARRLPDRRLSRSAMTTVAQRLADARRGVRRAADRRYGGFCAASPRPDAETLARDISRMQHVTVTTVPFQLGEGEAESGRRSTSSTPRMDAATASSQAEAPRHRRRNGGRSAVARGWGRRASSSPTWMASRVRVTVRSAHFAFSRCQERAALECTLVDDTGGSPAVPAPPNHRGIQIGTA